MSAGSGIWSNTSATWPNSRARRRYSLYSSNKKKDTTMIAISSSMSKTSSADTVISNRRDHLALSYSIDLPSLILKDGAKGGEINA